LGQGRKEDPFIFKKEFFLKPEHYGVNGCHDSKEIVNLGFCLNAFILYTKVLLTISKIINYLE
jgi:hypothetical protein